MADDPRDRSRAFVAAGVLFFDDVDRVMLVEPTYKDDWDLPGGYVESGETPAQAAAREVREELGIAVTPGPLLVADWAPHPNEGDKLLLIFDGGVYRRKRSPRFGCRPTRSPPTSSAPRPRPWQC